MSSRIKNAPSRPLASLAVSVIVLVAGLAPHGATADWPEFRGPFGNGHAAAPGTTKPAGLPLRWSETENVRWKTEIPHLGWSTPVVLGNQVWLTTATTAGNDFYVICVDAESGDIRSNRKLFHADSPEPLGNNVNCYASPSPVIEPGRVYIHFGSYGTACLDTETGKTLWQRTDLPCRHYRGPGSSAVLHENLLLLTFDGVDVQYVAALDKATGRTVWKTDRTTKWDDLDANGQPKREGDFRKAYSTPLVIDVAGKPHVLSIGSKAAFGYDLRTGEEIWSTRLPGYSCAPCPVFGDGLAFLVAGRGKPELLAMKVDGRGDVTGTHLAWKTGGRHVPNTPSPLLVDGLLYLLADNSAVSCLEAATGKDVWGERLGGNFMASPIYADGRIYCSSVQGKTTVLKAGRAYEVLAESRLASGFMASPAVSGSALFLRTKTHLYRVESKSTAP
jgi:outer membrane protein assembly factor BamB